MCMLHNLVLVLRRDEIRNDEVFQLDVPRNFPDALQNLFLLNLLIVAQCNTSNAL